MSITTDHAQPAIVGGLVIGVLSALPIISAGNLCCCLWVVSGGAVAAYLLQQNQPTAITAGDGALAGLMAGVVGALVYLVLSVPISILVAPMQRDLLERIFERWDAPPDFREVASRYVGGPVGIVISFINQLFVGVIFGTLGGVLGAVIFGKKLPPGTIDVPSTS